MTAPNPFKAKSAGRLPIGRDPVITIRVPPDLLAAIDRWARSEGGGGRMNRHAKKGVRATSRSDAIRKLVMKAFGTAGKRAIAKAETKRNRTRGEAFLDRHDGMREAVANCRTLPGKDTCPSPVKPGFPQKWKLFRN
jgi:hypothetical protein